MKKTFSSCLELLGFKLFGQKFLRDKFRIWAKNFIRILNFGADTQKKVFSNWPILTSFLFIFVLFTTQFDYKLKKHRCCAWDSNSGPQYGRRSRRRPPTPKKSLRSEPEDWARVDLLEIGLSRTDLFFFFFFLRSKTNQKKGKMMLPKGPTKRGKITPKVRSKIWPATAAHK